MAGALACGVLRGAALGVLLGAARGVLLGAARAVLLGAARGVLLGAALDVLRGATREVRLEVLGRLLGALAEDCRELGARTVFRLGAALLPRLLGTRAEGRV